MNLTANVENKLWGIYHTDREYAQTLGDPLRTTVEAPTKEAAEKVAAKLGFNDPWAHLIANEVATLAQRIIRRPSSCRQENNRHPSRGIRI